MWPDLNFDKQLCANFLWIVFRNNFRRFLKTVVTNLSVQIKYILQSYDTKILTFDNQNNNRDDFQNLQKKKEKHFLIVSLDIYNFFSTTVTEGVHGSKIELQGDSKKVETLWKVSVSFRIAD